MTLSIPAVVFAAFCVWLTVRIVNRRERWAKWALAVVVGFPVLYVASFGPYVAFIWATSPPEWLIECGGEFYTPLDRASRCGSEQTRLYFEQYGNWWMEQGEKFGAPR